MKYECKYEYTNRFNVVHQWSVVGARMGIHVHIGDMGEEYAKKYGGKRYSGGIEIHYRQPPDWLRDDLPHKSCWLLGGPCWHDGSSLQASEIWIPFWLQDPHDHERMFREIERELEMREADAHEQTMRQKLSEVSAALKEAEANA